MITKHNNEALSTYDSHGSSLKENTVSDMSNENSDNGITDF